MGTCKIPEPSLDYAGVASGCLCQGHISSRGQCCGTWGCRAMGWAAELSLMMLLSSKHG